MSKAEGGRHRALPQNRFVTLNDVRTIMRSIVTQVPLDSLYKHSAFHADVDHNGRFYYLTGGNPFITATHIKLERMTNNSPEGFSRDTFWLRKAGAYSGDYGFNPYFGRNANYVTIDFSAFDGFHNIPLAQKMQRVRFLDAANDAKQEDFDYEIRVALIDQPQNIRDMFWEISGMSEQQQAGVLRFRLKKSIHWRNMNLRDSLPGMVTNAETQVFYEANERDASIILSYLGGRIPYLPWIYENPEFDGKGKSAIPYQLASNIVFDNAEINSNNQVVIPIYFNGIAENAKSAVFNLNTNIINFESANSDVFVDFATNRAVIVADGYFAPNAPIAYLTVENIAQIEATDVRFDGQDASDVSYKLGSAENHFVDNMLAQNSPNPVVNHTTFEITIPETGNYSLMIYDLSGNVVKEIANGNFTANANYKFGWDATNANGEKVVDGTYIYVLTGENISISKKLVVIR